MEIFIPVSYTHLDVYKRQPHGSVDEIYNSIGLSPIKIAEKIKSL